MNSDTLAGIILIVMLVFGSIFLGFLIYKSDQIREVADNACIPYVMSSFVRNEYIVCKSQNGHNIVPWPAEKEDN